MIDLHTHSLLSDGALLPAELARRAEDRGYKALGITDHVDISNMEFVIDSILRITALLNKNKNLIVIPGIELTHMPVNSIKQAVKSARLQGIKLIIVHGETVVEPVIPGTNREALLSDIDILAHPGLISVEDGRLAAKRGICLEISGRKGHSFSNGHVANIARITGAKLVINTDSHEPEELILKERAIKILKGAGLDEKEIKRAFKNSEDIVAIKRQL